MNPSPAQGYTAYRNKYASKLKSSREAYLNYRKYLNWSKKSITSVINFLPFKVNLSPNSTCNLKCTMCEVSNFPNGSRAPDMSLDIFAQIISNNPHVLEYSISGLSEVTLLPELNSYLKLLNDSGSWIHMVTNGTLLHNSSVLDSIIQYCPDEIQVSIDSANPDVYQAIRRGSRFDRVCSNSRLLNQQLNKHGLSGRTKLCAVYQEDGLEGLKSLVELTSQLGFKVLAVTVDIHGWGHTTDQPFINEAHQSLLTSFDELSLLALSQDVRLEYVSTTRKYSSEPLSRPELNLRNSNRCAWPFIRAFISSDGFLVPCCHISSPAQSSFGLLTATNPKLSLDGINQNLILEDFRMRHLSGDIPRECQLCYREKPSS